MTVTEIISTVNNILNLGADVEASLSEQPVCATLLTCCNFTLEDMYRNYATCIRQTVVEAVDGFIPTNDVRLCRVFALTDSCGREARYKYTSGGLLVDVDGKYNLTYAKLPAELDFASEVTLPSPRITERMFVYGVIAEYLRMAGDYTAAGVWRDKLDAALSVATADKTTAKMPARRWLL